MVFCAEVYDVYFLALDTEVLSTTIAIIFSVPLTQRTVFNTDLGADSCGLHIIEIGLNLKKKLSLCLWGKIINYMHKQQTRLSYTLPIYNSEVFIKLANKDKYIYCILTKSTELT